MLQLGVFLLVDECFGLIYAWCSDVFCYIMIFALLLFGHILYQKL